MKTTRRLVLTLAAMGVMILLFSEVAIADTINGTEGPDTLKGTDGNDVLYGHGGNDTLEPQGGVDYVYGGTGNDTFRDGGNDEGWWPDLFSGEDGDDFIDAATKPGYDGRGAYGDSVYCGEGFDRVWYDYPIDDSTVRPGDYPSPDEY